MWTWMWIALAASPAALQGTQNKSTAQSNLEYTFQWLDGVEERREEAASGDEARDLELHSSFLELGAQVETLKNATSQILEELDVLRSRQAASSAVQASQVIMMVTYLLTILVTILVKRCKKVSEKAKRKEFERLEMQLRSSKAKRRAAAAKEKSAPAQNLE